MDRPTIPYPESLRCFRCNQPLTEPNPHSAPPPTNRLSTAPVFQSHWQTHLTHCLFCQQALPDLQLETPFPPPFTTFWTHNAPYTQTAEQRLVPKEYSTHLQDTTFTHRLEPEVKAELFGLLQNVKKQQKRKVVELVEPARQNVSIEIGEYKNPDEYTDDPDYIKWAEELEEGYGLVVEQGRREFKTLGEFGEREAAVWGGGGGSNEAAPSSSSGSSVKPGQGSSSSEDLGQDPDNEGDESGDGEKGEATPSSSESSSAGEPGQVPGNENNLSEPQASDSPVSFPARKPIGWWLEPSGMCKWDE